LKNHLPAHRTHIALSGIYINRAGRIGFLHRPQLPKSGESILDSATRRLTNLRSACRIAASATPLLLIASILLMRPIAFSGEIGLILAARFLIFSSISAIVAIIFSFSSCRDASVIFLVFRFLAFHNTEVSKKFVPSFFKKIQEIYAKFTLFLQFNGFKCQLIR
ncbi:MAG: hypothetical protein ACI9XO_004974, partial [Paraglaciecola sp.]